MRADLLRRQQWRKLAVQRAVMALTLAVYPHWHTEAELRREIGDAQKTDKAIKALIKVGLLERCKTPKMRTSVRPTEAAAHLERLRLP